MSRSNNRIKKATMKTKYYLSIAAFGCMAMMSSCNDLLDQHPYGSFTADQLTEKDVDGLMASAYAGLEAHFLGNNEAFSGPMTNWILDVRSDDALKGGGGISMESNIHQLEISNITSDNPSLLFKWKNNYYAISRVHQAMNAVQNMTSVTEDYKASMMGELQFLRAWFYFDLYHLFDRFPYFGENDDVNQVRYDNKTRAEIFSSIVGDLESAFATLPNTQTQPGRVNKFVAAALLARVNAFESNWTEVESWSKKVMDCGQYSMFDNYLDMSKIDYNNTHESILALQCSTANDNLHINWNNLLNVTYSEGDLYGSGDDFFHASQNLVDAFRTDANGLPYLDNAPNTHVIGDYYGNVDPRLDCTVGRVGFPWRGYTYTEKWIREKETYSGYSGKKWCIDPQDNRCIHTYPYSTSLNFIYIRYADIVLLHAEALIEQNKDMTTAMREINSIREKAQRTLSQCGAYSPVDINPMLADYKVGLYQSFPNQDYARKAVRMERRLELAMEGQRWFDLVRWGVAVDVINKYFETESQFESYYGDAKISSDELFWPVPYEEVNNANGLYN